MQKRSTSLTAFVVVAALEKLARLADFSAYFDGTWHRANQILARGAADSLLRRTLMHLPPSWALWLLDSLFVPGMMRHYLFRKRLLQQEAEHAITQGAQQIIVLGAGFDTLALRLAPAHPEVCFIEIDLPETQAAKLQLLSQLGTPRANCAHVSADLARVGLDHVLRQVPEFNPSAHTLVIVEGVLMYLKQASVESLFTTLDRHLTGELTVVFGATAASDQKGTPSLQLVNRFLTARQEATDWYCPARDMPSFLAEVGFRLDAWMPYRRLQALYIGDALASHVPEEDENYYRAVRSPRGSRVPPITDTNLIPHITQAPAPTRATPRKKIGRLERITLRDVPQQQLPQLIDRMFAIFLEFFEDLDHAGFVASYLTDPGTRLALCYGDDGALVGFSAAAINRVEVARRAHFVFSAPVLVGLGYRAGSELALFGLTEALLFKLRRPWAPLAYVSATATPASYGLFARTMTRFYPSVHEPTPDAVVDAMEEVRRQRRLERVGESPWVVRSGRPLGAQRLAADGTITDDQHAAFFREMSPRWLEGDALLVWIPLDLANIASGVARALIGRWRVARQST